MSTVAIFSQLPFAKGGIFSVGFKPLFGKEGKGRFFAKASMSYVANFWSPH
jgi:hypothetical protein